MKQSKSPATLNPWNEISMDKARKYTRRWQELYPINAFLFHRREIRRIKKQPDNKYIRFYMGLKDASDTSIANVAELIDMVAVGAMQSRVDNINKNSGVFNFPMPCPSTCDMRSPLIHLASNISEINETNKPCSELDATIEEISLDEASSWTLNWQQEYNIKSFLFNLEQLNMAMIKIGTDRVRIYFGMDKEDGIHAIMVGVNSTTCKDDETDMLYINKVSPCEKQRDNLDICCSTSPLYHNVD